MKYFEDEEVLIRTLSLKDAEIITREEIAQGWDASIEKYKNRIRDEEEGKAIALVAIYKGQPAGYINVYINSERGAFAHQGLCEIVDFGVLEKYRCRGIGSKLMDTAEKLAGNYNNKVYLGVGLHSGYGSAQKMYIKRGYVPDGSGVWYGEGVCEPYASCVNDDDLVLYLWKDLQEEKEV